MTRSTFALLVSTTMVVFLTHGFQQSPWHISRCLRPQPLSIVMASNEQSQLAESLRNLREKLNTPPEPIIAAVERMPEVPLSVADVAAKAGLDLNAARTQLMTLASLTGGDMEVTQDGEILYSFPRNVRAILQQRSLGQKIRTVTQAMAPYLLYVLRASFGVALLTSLAILFSTFVVVSSSTSNSEDDNRNNRRRGGMDFGGGGGGGFGFGRMDFSLADYFLYRPYYGYYQSPSYRSDYTSSTMTNRGRPLSFIESFFSYVFGDGDPNEAFPNEQLRYIADVIRQNDGVVVAEQLAPFLDPPAVGVTDMARGTDSSGSSSVVVDESWVLPAVLQLGGMPLATEEGDVVYRFDDLMSSGSGANQPATVSAKLIAEKEIPFSLASGVPKVLAGVLGVANLAGALWLGKVLANPVLLAQEPILLGTLSKLFPPLLIYAVLYNVIPAVRFAVLSKKNAEIGQRNQRRSEWSKFLATASPSLEKKISSAKRTLRLGSGDGYRASNSKEIVYSTKTDIDRGAEESEKEMMARFDKKLRDQ